MTDLYQYHLPHELIAQKPASPRDACRLFVYDTATDTIEFDTFYHLDRFLVPQSVMVLNHTKVVPARVRMKKDTGGEVEVLFLVNELGSEDLVKGMADRKLMVGRTVQINEKYRFEIIDQDEKIFFFKPLFPLAQLHSVLLKYGITPIPKYIGDSPLTEAELRTKYQTVFAQTPGSVAAPTASLHFTPRLFKKLAAKKIETAPVTLHVGMGTFAPVSEEQIAKKELFYEQYEVPDSSVTKILQSKKAEKPVVAVGTTSVRTLESWAARSHASSSTNLFIMPPFKFQVVDSLVTNFHVPRSSLMRLVEAFLQHKGARRHLVDLYQIAIKEQFQFYSFGDAMLIR